MNKLAKAACIVGAAALGVGLGLSLQSRWTRAQPRPAPLRFVGPPVAVPGGVAFQLSNATRKAVLYAAFPAEPKTNGQGQGPVDGAARPVAMGTIGSHQTVTIVVVPPTDGQVWRVPVGCRYAPSRWEVRKQALRRLFAPRTPTGFQLLTIYSPEVGP